MTLATLQHSDRLVRRGERLLTLATVLAAIEILRRTPRWLLLAAGLLLWAIVMLVLIYMAWIDLALGTVVAWKVGRGAVSGWRRLCASG